MMGSVASKLVKPSGGGGGNSNNKDNVATEEIAQVKNPTPWR
jgi:hypothetical protein